MRQNLHWHQVVRCLIIGLLLLPLPALAFTDGQFEQAMQLLDQLVAAARQGQIEQVDRIKQHIESIPKPPRGDRKQARQYNDVGLERFRQSNYRQAFAYFQEALKVDPGDVEVVANAGHACLMLEDESCALTHLRLALILDPDRTASWVPMAEALAQLDQPDSAAAAYALAYHFSGNREKTRAFLETAGLKPNPKVAEAIRVAFQSPLMSSKSVSDEVTLALANKDEDELVEVTPSSANEDEDKLGEVTLALANEDKNHNEQPGNKRNIIIRSGSQYSFTGAGFFNPKTDLYTEAEAKAKTEAKAKKEEEERKKLMEEQKRKEAHARYQASLVGPERAKKLGVQWDLNEDLDPMTDELLLRSSASFTGESDLVIQIEASCLVSKKQLEVTASAFNLKDEGVSFIAETAIDLFGVQRVATKTLVRFDDNKPQEALFAIRNYSNHIPIDINGWLYFYEVRIKFNLDYGAVIAKIAPYEHNLYKVFEACTEY